MSKNWKLKYRKGKGYWYEDENGEKSEIFEHAYKYSDGFGLVVLGNGKRAYKDVNGKLSEEYKWADSYSNANGFGRVQLKNGKWAYRDVDGNLFNRSECNTIKRFNKGDVDVYSLKDEFFANDKILASILKKLKRDAYRFIKLAQSKEQLEAAKEYYIDAMEYVLSTAHDIRKENEKQKKLEEQERIKKKQEADKWSAIQDKLIEELNLK